MRKSLLAMVCVCVAAVGGCQSVCRITSGTAKFVGVGLWNGIFDDDISYQYDSRQKRWNVVDEVEQSSDIPWSESMEYHGGP
ncbi:MAG: hypothetical protein ACK52S_20825 [Pirellula sp.]|jgi:hypothetical protein